MKLNPSLIIIALPMYFLRIGKYWNPSLDAVKFEIGKVLNVVLDPMTALPIHRIMLGTLIISLSDRTILKGLIAS